MTKYFWVKDFENTYRIIEKNKTNNITKYSCISTDIVTNLINENNLLYEISPPILFNNISKMDNKDELFNLILERMQFNNKIFENILIDVFVNGLSYDEISKKHNKCKPSISRIVKKFKSFYYCQDCKKVYSIKENNILTEGYYWVIIDNVINIIFLYKKDNNYKAKGFGLKKGVTYDIDFIKSKILFKIAPPIDQEDLNTIEGIYRKINKIESEGRKYHTNTKKAVVDVILFKDRLIDNSNKYKVNVSNISRLRKKVLSKVCQSCGNTV